MIERKIKKYIYSRTTTLQQAIHDLYRNKTGICLICDKGMRLDGILTIGDIKDAILRGFNPASSVVADVMNKNFVWAYDKSDKAEFEKLSRGSAKYDGGFLEKLPLLDKAGVLKGLFINDKIQEKNNRVLVTGGAGYVGSILCRKLLARGYRVVVLDNLSFGHDSIKDLMVDKKFKLIRGDIRNISDLTRGIKEADYVIHLAGIVGDPASSLDPIRTLEANHFSTKSLIDICKYYQVHKFIFASSCSVYGAGSKILTEKRKPDPLSLYAKTKVFAENSLLFGADKYFNPIILRFGTLYGLSPRMRFDLVVNTMTAHAFFNKKIIVNGGSQWRPLLHVSDAAEACICVLEAPLAKVSGQIFNIGSDAQNFTINQIAKSIKQLSRAEIEIKDAKEDRRDYRVSFAKIKQTLGFKTLIPLNMGISEVLDSFRRGEYADFKDRRFSNYLSSIRNI